MNATFLFDGPIVLRSEGDKLFDYGFDRLSFQVNRARNDSDGEAAATKSRRIITMSLKAPSSENHACQLTRELVMFVVIRQRFALYAP
jgi:hypothetical protein